MPRLILSLLAAGALALPATAAAHEGGDGKGQRVSLGAPTATDLPGARGELSADASAPAAGDAVTLGAPDDPAAGDATTALPVLPELAPAFLRRTFKLAGEANGFDSGSGTLSLTIDRVGGLRGRMRDVRDALEGADADVLVGPRTRVVDADGQSVDPADVADVLDGATEVVVNGRVLDPKRWNADADGTPVVSVRAKRIRVRD